MVSIIIPVYNSELFISETIQSAINQTYKNTEIIIVDNDSKDGSWEIIKKFQEKDNRIKSFRNQTNEGPVRNWLRCVEMASGHYIKILWSDDLIAENFIEKTLPLFSEDVGFVFTGGMSCCTSVIETILLVSIVSALGLRSCCSSDLNLFKKSGISKSSYYFRTRKYL